jgi:hypothetical protein
MKRLAAAGLLLLGSLALATPSGHKWFPARLPVHYQVFAHTAINGMPANSFTTAVLPRVQEAFLNWTSTRVACTSWSSTYDGTFSSPSDTTAVNGNDMQNRVIWLGGANWRYAASTLGLTTTLYYPNTGEIIDADMELNDNVTWANTGSANSYDYESVVLHEAGHFLGLDHTNNVSAAVMYPTVANGQIKRSLYTTDVNDVCGVYPSGGMGMGAQGAPCSAPTDCLTGLVCRTLQGSSSGKICTVDCTTNPNACTTVAPLTCQNADTGKACLPPAAGVDYCMFCVDGTSCTSGNCITDGIGHNWCTNPCSTVAPCPAGSLCLDVASAQLCQSTSGSCICAPTPTAQGAVLCPSQCTGTTCGTTPGYGCNGTTCEATGNEGDRCELSGLCQSCLLCIGTMAAANCRRCCAGMAQGANCSSCPNATCASGQSCQTVGTGPDGICYPQGGADICQACTATVTCLNGNTCIGGKCHASCNPQSPGTCSACQPTGTTTGLCACPGEARNEGDGCGGSGVVSACLTGLVCSGGTCKRTCVVGSTSSCPSGQVCQNVSGVAVCVGDTAGARCAACNGLNCAPGNTCYQGRCYTTCNVTVKNGPCDSSCVDVGSGLNICACDDQIRGSGAPCGSNPIAACSDGLLCVQGTCLGECNPNTPTCPILTECKLLSGTQGTFVCQPIDMSGTGGGGGGTPDGDCTTSGVCPTGTSCVPNGDGTATCKSDGATCDPNGPASQCSANTVCRAVDGQPSRFACQSPNLGNDGGCGCNSDVSGALVMLAALLQRRRRS